MSRSARLAAAGPRVRLPEHAPDGDDVAVGPGMGPVRTCVGCRERGLRSVLLRVVQVGASEGREAHAVVDTERSRPGRGAWLHPDLQCLDLAERRRAIPRALRSGPLDTTALREVVEAQVSRGTGE